MKMTEATKNPFETETDEELQAIEDMEAEEAHLNAALPEVEELDEVPATAVAAEESKDAKPASKSTKPPTPEGYITPVAFAHVLTAKLREEGKLGEKEAFPPQMVYSYVKQGQSPKTKDPLKSYSEGGRNNLLKLEEALAWWDAKEKRKKEREATKAAKATAAPSPAAPGSEQAPAAVPNAPVEEVE